MGTGEVIMTYVATLEPGGQLDVDELDKFAKGQNWLTSAANQTRLPKLARQGLIRHEGRRYCRLAEAEERRR